MSADAAADPVGALDLLRRPTWHRLAACRGRDPEEFYPTRGENAQTAQAKAVCASCPVDERCLADHLDETAGIFGGTTPAERRLLRRAARTA